MKKALILVDVQKDYFAGGKSELFMPEAAAGNVKMLLDRFRQENLDIFHIQHISTNEKAGFFRPGTEGVDIYPLVSPAPCETVIIKHNPDAFWETELEQALKSRQIESLVICGMMSHMCIDTTVRSAKRLNFTVLLAEDACTTKDLNWCGTLIPARTVHDTMMAALNGTKVDVRDYVGETK
jgi:nicotinamidase-related amidase